MTIGYWTRRVCREGSDFRALGGRLGKTRQSEMGKASSEKTGLAMHNCDSLVQESTTDVAMHSHPAALLADSRGFCALQVGSGCKLQ